MRIHNLVAVAVCCVAGAAAQDRITVPISNPAQPVTVKANLVSGSIRVTGGTGKDLVVTTSEGGSRSRNQDAAPPGMKRIGSRSGLNVEEDHNVVTISAGGAGAGADLTIEAPANTNLQLKTVSGGSIEVTGVNGDLEVENLNGSITMTNVSGSVVAHTLNGGVTVSMERVTGNKPMSFTSLNGKVDVTLPGDAKARLRMKTDNGAIYSDFDVKLEADAAKPIIEDTRGQPTPPELAQMDKDIAAAEARLQELLKSRTRSHPEVVAAQRELTAAQRSRDRVAARAGGKYKITVDKAVTGTINGGGPEYTFQTMNGNILIHKK